LLRWDLYNGGIKEANVREQMGRADQVHGMVFQRTREAEETTRNAWSRLQNQRRLAGELESQGKISDDLLLSYREQFNIGRRSLLDVLDAQNTRYNVQAQTETARLAALYAQYRLLASVNRLTEALGVSIPTAAYSNYRERYRVNPIPPEQLQENALPAPAMGPPAGYVAVAPAPVPAASAVVAAQPTPAGR
jgi:outer membrane protein, adhesin transport system